MLHAKQCMIGLFCIHNSLVYIIDCLMNIPDKLLHLKSCLIHHLKSVEGRNVTARSLDPTHTAKLQVHYCDEAYI